MVAIALILAPRAAAAHTVNLSQGAAIREGARDVTLEVAFAKADYERLGKEPWARLRDTQGAACREDSSTAHPAEDGMVVQLHASCTDKPQTIRFELWPRLDPRHRLLFHVADRDVIVEPSSTEVSLHPEAADAPQGPVGSLRALRLGFEHVALGYDHLLFLFGLALASTVAGEKRRRLFLAVTAFTLTHTAALAFAFRGAVTIPERPVEVLIACTIGFVGLEVLRRGRRAGASPLACAGFGCVHGLGFGTAFRGALGTTTAGTLALATIGVEAAQLLGVSAALVLLHLPGVTHAKVRRALAALLFVVGLVLAAFRALH